MERRRSKSPSFPSYVSKAVLTKEAQRIWGPNAMSKHYRLKLHHDVHVNVATSTICLSRPIWLTRVCLLVIIVLATDTQRRMWGDGISWFFMLWHAALKILLSIWASWSCVSQPHLLIECDSTALDIFFSFSKTFDYLLFKNISDFWEVRPSSWEDYKALQEE